LESERLIGKYLQKRRRDISYIPQKKEEYRYEKLCNFCEKHGRGGGYTEGRVGGDMPQNT